MQHTTKLEKFNDEYEENKAKIQKAFYEVKKLRIDQVRRDGGSSTDGNTVRRALEDPEFVAKQINQPVELVVRFKTIWLCLTSGLPISPVLFGKFGKETKGMSH